MYKSLYYLLGIILIMGCGEESAPETTTVERPIEQAAPELIDGEYNAIITVVNDGMSAWLITNIQGSNVIASLNSQNVVMRLNKGLRYKFINDGGVNHPLDFRDINGEYLLTQDTISGKYEEDAAVDFAFNYGEGSVAFTITDELAAELASYNCAFHVPMTGGVIVN